MRNLIMEFVGNTVPKMLTQNQRGISTILICAFAPDMFCSENSRTASSYAARGRTSSVTL